MAKRYYCNRRLRHRGKWLQPGDEIVVEPFMKIGPWVHMDYVRVVEDSDAAPLPAPVKEPVVAVAEDLGGLKKAELVALLGERGHSLGDITGTGSGGSVTKHDLVSFLEGG